MTPAAPSTPDLAALNDTLAVCMTAVLEAWRGNPDSASLALLEAHAAAEEAFGTGSPEIDALSVVFAAIKQAADRGAGNTAGRPEPKSNAIGRTRL
jgi:hypothetical protein